MKITDVEAIALAVPMEKQIAAPIAMPRADDLPNYDIASHPVPTPTNPLGVKGVGEGGAIEKGLAMTRNAGFYYIVGYGGRIEIPAIEMIITEKTIVGNLVGTYAELVELMALADRGLVNLATKEYKLADANQALHDLHAGTVKGRAVLIP